MSNTTKQVQHKPHRRSHVKRNRGLEREEKVAKAALVAQLDAGEWGPFYQPHGARRIYPGEAEAIYVMGHINFLASRPCWKKQKATFLKKFHILRDYEVRLNRNSDKARKNVEAPLRVALLWEELERTIKSGRPSTVGIQKEGLVIQPTRVEGVAALGLLALSVRYGRLTRIRPCVRCRTLFYARFNRQRFCNDPAKKCQWNHYHSSEWRKQHYEQNRKHQAAWRKRTFGNGKR